MSRDERMLGQAAEPYTKRTTHSQRRMSQRLKVVTTREQRRRERQTFRSRAAAALDAFIADARQAGATDTHCVWNQEADRG